MHPEPTLPVRVAVAEDEAARLTERSIQRARVVCVVVGIGQTAVYPGDRTWVGWACVALLGAVAAAVGLALHRPPASSGSIVRTVGIGAMVGDTVAVAALLANLQGDPTDPIQLLPLILVVEAAARWGRVGGLASGLGAGLLSAGWAVSVHHRHHLDLPLAFVSFRILFLVLVGGVVGTTVRQAHQQRRAAEAVFNASRDLVATFGLDGRLRTVNPACEAILGYRPDELIGRDRSFLLDLDDRPGPVDVEAYRRDGARLEEVRVVHRDGRLVWLELDLLPDLKAGVVHAIGRDVSARRRTESELRHRVDHDGLTGVANRNAMLAYLSRMLDRGYRPGLVFIDLDDFKAVNDCYGHAAGDRLLIDLAGRLCAATATEGSVARYAGDEFCIVVDDADELESVARAVRRAVEEPFALDDAVLAVSVTLGLAVGDPADSPEALVDRADRAMYAAKGRPRLP